MRVFLTLCSLAAVALAKPQYNYGSGVSGTFGSGSSSGSVGGFGNFGIGHSGPFGAGGGGGSAGKFTGGNAGFSSGSTFHSGGSAFGSGTSFGSGAIGGGSSFGSGAIGGGSFGSGSIGGGGHNFQSSSGHHNQESHHGGQFEAPLVHKQFITVAAPEDNDNLERSKHLVIGRPQKNYRVVFIKAPSSSNANVKLSAEYAPKEEKTVIYVLSKKDSSLEINDIATPAPTVPAKPEVFFIKYKTEEEAQHAQRQIQAEYDKIEGSSEHTDAGVAPQQSVVGILGNGNAGAGAGAGSGSFHGAGGASSGSFASAGSSSNFGGNFGGNSVSAGGNHGSGKAPAYLPPATL